jgi:hypothetical protein
MRSACEAQRERSLERKAQEPLLRPQSPEVTARDGDLLALPFLIRLAAPDGHPQPVRHLLHIGHGQGTAHISLHSLARFYERSGQREDAEVISAMTSALQIEPGDHQPGEEVQAGQWRGLIKWRAVADGCMAMWCARTWIA